MTAIAFTLILTGVLLNAAAQLLLKAGTNAVGHCDFQLANVIPIGMKIAGEPFIIGGMACYAVSVVVWITTYLIRGAKWPQMNNSKRQHQPLSRFSSPHSHR